MSEDYEYDIINGRRVPQTVINGNHTIADIHQGTIHVEAGKLSLTGTLKGTLSIKSGAEAHIAGRQQGTVSLQRDTRAVVTGEIEGTTVVANGATLIIEETGKLAGTLTNEGLVILRGVFGGARSGAGDFRIEGSGRVKQPVVRDGIQYYDW